MKKALALVLALVLALSMGVSAFATELVVLNPVPTATDAPVEIEVVDAWDDTYVLYTTPVVDEENFEVALETEYYIALADLPYTDVKVTANGNVDAELVEYDPEKMVVEGMDITYKITKKGEDYATGLDYEYAVAHCADLNDAEEVTYYDVVLETNVNIIKVTVANNFSAHYEEGSIKIEAKLDKKAHSKTLTVINDVTIFEYEQVKWAAANNADGAYLQLGDKGYSDYLTESGYGWEYEVENLRQDPFALVVSTTAFRAIEGKDLTLAAYKGEYGEVSVTLKEVAKGQKGVNFFAWAEIKGVDLESEDYNPTAVSFGFKGNQTIVGKYVITVDLPINYYELRELFGVRVEEDDIVTYYIVDENGKVVGGKEVDYMTADLTENVEFTVEGENDTLGWYTLCLEVPAAEDGEENPNTGAESVVGVVAALAVVSVATAAAVSLKK